MLWYVSEQHVDRQNVALQAGRFGDRCSDKLDEFRLGHDIKTACKRTEFNGDDFGAAGLAAMIDMGGIILMRVDPSRTPDERVVISCPPNRLG